MWSSCICPAPPGPAVLTPPGPARVGNSRFREPGFLPENQRAPCITACELRARPLRRAVPGHAWLLPGSMCAFTMARRRATGPVLAGLGGPGRAPPGLTLTTPTPLQQILSSRTVQRTQCQHSTLSRHLHGNTEAAGHSDRGCLSMT